MASKNQKANEKPDFVSKAQSRAKMYVLNPISPDEFAKAMGKYNYAKSQK